MNLLYNFIPTIESSLLKHIVEDEKSTINDFLEKVEDEASILIINLNTWNIHSQFQHLIKKKKLHLSVVFQKNSIPQDIKNIQRNIIGEEVEKNIVLYNNLKHFYIENNSHNIKKNNFKYHYVFWIHLYSIEEWTNNIHFIRKMCFPMSSWQIYLFLTKDINKDIKKKEVQSMFGCLEQEHPFLETIDKVRDSLVEFITNQKIEEFKKTSYLYIGEKIRYHIELTIDQSKLFVGKIVDVI